MQCNNILLMTLIFTNKSSIGYSNIIEESPAYDWNCADIFQMKNNSLYTSEPNHELD